MCEQEEWRDIVGYEGLYQVSNKGRVKAVEKIDAAGKTRKERMLKAGMSQQGRPRIELHKNKIGTTYFVHRLVAMAFIPNPENKKEVNHINGIKDDNRVENLEWCTRSENMLHAERYGLHSMAKALEAHRKKVCQILNRSVIAIYDSIADASAATGIDHRSISAAASGKNGQAGGYEWRYYNVE